MSATGGPGIRAGAYCPSCGAERVGGAPYCAGCGHHFANGNASAATVQQPVAQPTGLAPVAAPPDAARERRTPPWPVIAGAAVVIAAAAVVAVLLLSGGQTSAGYQQRLVAQVAKVTAADDALATELEALRPGGAPATSLAAANGAAAATHDAQVALDVLTTPSNKQSLHAETDAALASQDAYLAGVIAALRNPSDAAAANLTPLASDARSHWAGLGVLIPGAGGRIGGYQQLAAWVHAKTSSRTTGGATSGKPTKPSGGTTTSADQALVAYVAGIEETLAFARPGFDRINQVYTGMKAGTISWEDARVGLDYVLANRQDALARANSLNAPTAAAAEVKRLLAAALEASLVNDRDILAAFNSYATEEVESFYNSQVLASASSSAASSAKRSFLSAYNSLRSSAGLGATQFTNF
jgi:hypothetical protein